MKFADENLEIAGTNVTIARVISRLTPAPLFNLYVGIIISFTSPIGLGDVLTPISALLICIAFMVIAPIIPIIYEAWKGNVDLDVSEQEMRSKFFVFAIFCYLVATFSYFILDCHILMVLSIAYVTVTMGVMLATHWTKVSVHCAGVGGPGTALIICYGSVALVVVPVWLMVIWSRPILQQHTLSQSILGVIIAVLITICTYLIFW